MAVVIGRGQLSTRRLHLCPMSAAGATASAASTYPATPATPAAAPEACCKHAPEEAGQPRLTREALTLRLGDGLDGGTLNNNAWRCMQRAGKGGRCGGESIVGGAGMELLKTREQPDL